VNQPLISAIVPAYEHERFIASALRSLAGQTYPSLELIVSDDGSSDATVAQVQALLPELTARFERIELVTNPHRGIAQNLRTCLERAESDFVFILDSDDVANPQAIERLFPLLDPPDIALAVGDNSFIGPDGVECLLRRGTESFSSFIAYNTAGRQFEAERDFGTYTSLIAGNYIPNGWLVRKSAVEAVGGYLQGFLIDDWELLLRLVKRFRLAFTPESLLRYRVHDRNTVRVQHRQMFLETARILIREKPYSAAHGALDSWWSHARLVISALSIADLESGSFLQDLFPDLSTSDRDAVLTLTTAMSRAKTYGRLLEPAGTSVPRALPAGSRGERIYLFANCWNDARILPFFFRHYDSLVERYVIYDDGSTDGSLDLLAAHPRVDVRRFVWTHPDSFVLSELDHYNEIWKECRETADWVLLVDLDELLHASDLGAQLRSYRSRGISVVPAHGFEMVTDDFPSPDETLAQTRRFGVPSPAMSKLVAFAPRAVDQLNHTPGGHTSSPTGRIVAPPRDDVRLLHYKYLGLDYLHNRDGALRARLGPLDRAQEWARHWDESRDGASATLQRYRSGAVDVFDGVAIPTTAQGWENLPRLADREHHRELEAARTSLAKEVARVLQGVEQVRSEMAAASSQMAQERERWEKERSELSDSLQSAVHRAGTLGTSLEGASARVAALESSRTWRWTRPARDLAAFASRLFRKQSRR
jgi:glycosyltransferase involved in cell wall biosynthesis